MERIVLNNIKKIRKSLNMTTRELANKSELSHSTISDIENGISLPNQLTAMLISRALNKNVCDVFILDTDILDSYLGRNSDHSK